MVAVIVPALEPLEHQEAGFGVQGFGFWDLGV